MPNLSLTKVISLVASLILVGYFYFRLITSSEFILNMAGYVFLAITILTLGSYFIYKTLGDPSDGNSGEIY